MFFKGIHICGKAMCLMCNVMKVLIICAMFYGSIQATEWLMPEIVSPAYTQVLCVLTGTVVFFLSVGVMLMVEGMCTSWWEDIEESHLPLVNSVSRWKWCSDIAKAGGACAVPALYAWYDWKAGLLSVASLSELVVWILISVLVLLVFFAVWDMEVQLKEQPG